VWVEEIKVTTNQLWFNLAQLFSHLWTVTKVGRCRLTLSNPRCERLELSVLKLKHDF